MIAMAAGLALAVFLALHDRKYKSISQMDSKEVANAVRDRAQELLGQLKHVSDRDVRADMENVVMQTLKDVTGDEILKEGIRKETLENNVILRTVEKALLKQADELKTLLAMLEEGKKEALTIAPGLEAECNEFEHGGLNCLQKKYDVKVPSELVDLDIGDVDKHMLALNNEQRKNRFRVRQFLMDELEKVLVKLQDVRRNMDQIGDESQAVDKQIAEINRSRYKNLMAMILLRHDQTDNVPVPMYVPRMLAQRPEVVVSNVDGKVSFSIESPKVSSPVEYIKDATQEVRKLGNTIFTAVKENDRLELITEELGGGDSKWKYFYPEAMFIPKFSPADNPEMPIYAVLDNMDKIRFREVVQHLRRPMELKNNLHMKSLATLSLWVQDDGGPRSLIPFSLGAGEISPYINKRLEGYVVVHDYKIICYLVLDGGRLKLLV